MCNRLHKVRKMSKKSTIHDIAKELNVTASTVSRALSGNPRISDSTREAVLDMAKKLNYQHNQIAAALRSGRSYTIGVIVPTADRSFFSKVVRGIEEEASKAGYNVIICQSYDQLEKEQENVEALLRLRADGIIASIAKETKTFEHFQQLKLRNVPLVLFDRVNENLGVSTVVIDDFLGAYKATKHLIEQGCSRIAHFAGLQHINIYRERFRGYTQALFEAGLPVEDSLVLYFKDLLVEDGNAGMQQLLALENPPDAVFSASDYAALGAMQMLKEKRLRIPEDVALVGFANEPFTSFVEPALSTVDQHSQQMGMAIARLFFEEIQAPKQSRVSRQVILTPELLIRGSSLRLK